LTRIVKVSEELLQDVFFDLQGWLARKFGNAFGIAEESAFVNGVGSTKPLGVVRSASAGSTAHLHNDIATDELIDLFHSLKRAYRANGSFLMNDSTALLIRKKKDGRGVTSGRKACKPESRMCCSGSRFTLPTSCQPLITRVTKQSCLETSPTTRLQTVRRVALPA
jgi:predicted phage gp36 major capsid-like protein